MCIFKILKLFTSVSTFTQIVCYLYIHNLLLFQITLNITEINAFNINTIVNNYHIIIT